WNLDTEPIDMDDLPRSAFDSSDEKQRVAELIDRYNHPDSQSQPIKQRTTGSLPPSPTPTPAPTPSSSQQQAKESDQEANADQNEEDKEADESEPHGPVEMTPQIDDAFAQLARERVARHPFLFYVWLPLKRARTLWFDTHSQYWPFEGTLFPL